VKRTTIEQTLLVTGLIAATVGIRLYFQDIPNFAPVAAVSLFAGYLLSSRRLAVIVPLGAMLISDQLLGGYQPLLMLTVYTLLALPVMMSGWLRRRFGTFGSAASAAKSVAGLLTCTLTTSIAFFVGTNLMVWLVTPWFARTPAGLIQCYANAVPFFRYTLAGDITFATILFGGYAAWQCWSGPIVARSVSEGPSEYSLPISSHGVRRLLSRLTA
jgi:hypothetical protein